MGMSYLPSHLKTWPIRLDTFCSPRLVFITTTLGLVNLYLFLNRALPLQRCFFPVESQGAVIKRWYHRFWHAVAGPDLFRAFWGGRGIEPVLDTEFFVCWTGGWIKYIQIHSKTDVHLVYIFGGATLVRVLLVFMKKRITWAVAKTHPRLHYDVGLLKKTYSLQYHHCGIWGKSKMQ